MMQTYSDEYLEHWGEIYLACDAAKSTIYFEVFLQNPQAFMDAITATEQLHGSLDKLEMLLPIIKRDEVNDDEAIQEEIEKRFERKGHVVEMHGHKNIERLRHRECPKKWKTNTRVKTGGVS